LETRQKQRPGNHLSTVGVDRAANRASGLNRDGSETLFIELTGINIDDSLV